jgi:hypothetical protein
MNKFASLALLGPRQRHIACSQLVIALISPDMSSSTNLHVQRAKLVPEHSCLTLPSDEECSMKSSKEPLVSLELLEEDQEALSNRGLELNNIGGA